jgi:hypothetical protein
MEKEELWIEAYKLRDPQISPSGTLASWKQYRRLNKLDQRRIGVVYCTWYQQISLGIRSRYPPAEHGAIQLKNWGLMDSLHVRSDEDDTHEALGRIQEIKNSAKLFLRSTRESWNSVIELGRGLQPARSITN